MSGKITVKQLEQDMNTRLSSMEAAMTSLVDTLSTLVKAQHGMSSPAKEEEVPVLREESSAEVTEAFRGLFADALESCTFVTYAQAVEALGLKFVPTNIGVACKAAAELGGLDAIIVKNNGQYGKSAPIAEFHARLKEWGYTEFPTVAAKKATKAKGLDLSSIDLQKLAKLQAMGLI